jgi:NADPH-dependent curcumin reductase CurA
VSDVNRRFLLRERPTGRIDDRTFELVEEAVPEIGAGEALVRTRWISLDPTNRAWIGETPTYLPPVAIGEVMRAGGLGEVVASNSPDYQVGKLVQGRTGWQDYVVASASAPMTPIPEIPGVSPSYFLGALGMTGLTAYVGMFDIGRPKSDETVVVSAAAGAVGSVAGQLAKIKGARVVGIAGGQEKCALLTGELGFDVAVDYKAPDWRAHLKSATPDGIDVDFENVGGEIMEAVFGRLNVRARVALCGLISGYNDDAPAVSAGPRNFGNLLIQRVHLEGFIVLDHFGRAREIVPRLAGWMAEGKLKAQETVVEGFEQLPVAINMLFDGQNTGKLVVKL